MPIGQLADAGARVFLLDIDDVIRPKLLGERQLLCVARQTGHDDRIRAGGARSNDARQAALARTEDQHTIARARVGQLHGPAKAGTQRVEHHGDVRGDLLTHGMHE